MSGFRIETNQRTATFLTQKPNQKTEPFSRLKPNPDIFFIAERLSQISQFPLRGTHKEPNRDTESFFVLKILTRAIFDIFFFKTNRRSNF